jgi:NDP-sugar pyrophosphorylase family protein
MILAGGLGTRLRSVVADRPKVLAEVAGRPFLALLLDQLASAECQHVVLCTGHQAEQVEAAFGREYAGMRLAYSREQVQLGTGGAVRLALPLVEGDGCLVLNGDSYCAADLSLFKHWHGARQAKASLLLTRADDTSRYGRVEVAPDGQVSTFVEKGSAIGPGWINAGIYLIQREMLELIATDRVVSLERDVFPAWIGAGLFGSTCEAPFTDIGVPASYHAAADFFRGLAA